MAKCAHRSVLEHEGDATNLSKTVHIENSYVWTKTRSNIDAFLKR